jgi:hypothetical protein
MSIAFDSADPVTGHALRTIDDEIWDANPVGIVDFPDSRALVVRQSKRSGLPHAEHGRWSLYYFNDNPQHPLLLRSFRDFRVSGSWGEPGVGTLAMLDGVTPAWIVESGGTWQGITCQWVSIDIIGSDGPRVLLSSILSSATSPDVSASLVSPLSRFDMELEYIGHRIVLT